MYSDLNVLAAALHLGYAMMCGLPHAPAIGRSSTEAILFWDCARFAQVFSGLPDLLPSVLFFRLNAVELAQFTLRIQLAHVVGGELAPFTNPFLLGLVPLDIMLAHAFLRVLVLPKTSSASLSQRATAG